MKTKWERERKGLTKYSLPFVLTLHHANEADLDTSFDTKSSSVNFIDCNNMAENIPKINLKKLCCINFKCQNIWNDDTTTPSSSDHITFLNGR